ncbi:hypothetical protein FISHEDRAFT_67676 [Fistulina hepatica ATCC 64428]|nr:hypothetical protein FISHEDRAFT_67676 [Fistulina hepatica ATCC 64428]
MPDSPHSSLSTPIAIATPAHTSISHPAESSGAAAPALTTALPPQSPAMTSESSQSTSSQSHGDDASSDTSDVEILMRTLGIDESPVASATFGIASETKQQAATVQAAVNTTQVTFTRLPDIDLPSLSLSSNAVALPGEAKTSDEQDSESEDVSDKTPNVYINGLPPHFPEEELFALAAPFGAVRSVRSFTRHVGERESGYGFVLFETMTAAEKCIQSLRRYRNLHPTFSKQVHKIPGTNYASKSGIPKAESSTSSESSSFKERMERLHDFSSTNLYIEGLPLSIDEPTLSALVSPHIIRSSRFFQTRLSNPPRIIAFVRLDTRAGAEEVIERLHGRMVRGWNDPGSRISVRFADTGEQRELRRNERSTREGEQSPSRITIAQAALLNLRGPDLGTRRGLPRQDLDLRGHEPLPSHPSIPSSLSTGSLAGHALRRHFPGYVEEGDVYDFSSNASGRGGARSGLTPTRMRQMAPYYQQGHAGLSGQVQDIGPSLSGLFDPVNPGYAGDEALDFRQQFPHTLRNSGVDLGHTTAYGSQTYQSQAVQARNGYTPAEEYIIQAHTNGRRRNNGLNIDERGNIGIGVRGYRAQASALSYPRQPDGRRGPSLSQSPQLDTMSGMSEDEFHATAAPRSIQLTHSPLVDMHREHRTQSSFSSQASEPHNSGFNLQQQHMRSTTLPHPSSSSATSLNQRSLRGFPSIKNSQNIGSYDQHDSTNMNTRTYDSHNNIEHASPPLVSPTLTYSSRTPATMSPATPFFGSFAAQAEGFESSHNHKHHNDEHPVVDQPVLRTTAAAT